MDMLRKWFGPGKEEIWRQLCTDLGAEYEKGGFWKGDKVQVTRGEWTITLDTYAVSTGETTMVYTRMRAPYVNPDGFRFTIYRSGLFSDIARWFGMQDIAVGQDAFDRDFTIKGTDEEKVRALFDNARLRQLIASQPHIYLTVKDDEGWFGANYPKGTDVLSFHVGGIIKDLERLKLLFDLFAETLDQLCRIGSAYEDAPNVTL